MSDADWVPGDPVYPHPETSEYVLTTCRLCGTTWTAELSSCPSGCVWEGDNKE